MSNSNESAKRKKGNFFTRFLKKIIRRMVLSIWRIEDDISASKGREQTTVNNSDDFLLYRSTQIIDDNILIHYNKGDWYITKDKGVVFDSSVIRLDVEPDKSVYAAYKETNCKFSIVGTSDFSIPQGEYSVSFRAAFSENASCRVVLLGYVNGRKIELGRIPANTAFSLSIDQKYDSFRIALQLSGTGAVMIEGIDFMRARSTVDIGQAIAMDNIPVTPLDNSWFFPEGTPYISYHDNVWTINATAKNQFISYLARNLKFSSLPDTTLPLSHDRYRIYFDGEITGDLIATLCIIPYINGEKQFMWQIPLGENKYFLFPKDDCAYRLVLKFEGEGTFSNAKVRFIEQPGENTPVMNQIRTNAAKMHQPLTTVSDSVKKYRIGVVFDEFTMGCFANEADYVLLSPTSWQQQLTDEHLDFVFVESAWHGNNSLWDNMIPDLETHPDSPLPAMIQFCNRQQIPTVFWCKEDPVNYEHFINAAKLFDYVYTTDADIVDQYKRDVGHNHCYCLQFAANPMLHNPIDRYRINIGSLAFAGSWLDHRHEDRKREMHDVLYPSLAFGLQVFDRNFNKMVNPNYRFPEDFTPHIIGSLAFTLMSATYKMYDIFLNVNSVTTSTTMFARRVFELMACGTAVVSGYSLGIDHTFGKLVSMCEGESETRRAVSKLQNSKEYRDRLALQGIREVFSKHTYQRRFRMILENMGLESPEDTTPTVNVFAVVDSQTQADEILESFRRQSITKKHLLLLSSAALTFDRTDADVTVLSLLNGDALRENEASYVAVMAPGCHYGENYLKDLLLSTVYTRAMIFGKSAYYYVSDGKVLVKNCREEHTFVTDICPDALVFSVDVLSTVKLPTENGKPNWRVFIENAVSMDFPIYSADRFNFTPVSASCTPDEQADRIVSYSASFDSDC